MDLIISWLGDLWEQLARLFTSPPGDGQMKVAAFVRYKGADGLGHVGWGFDYDDAYVNAGSVENPQGAPTSPLAAMGYWCAFLPNPIPTMLSKEYDSLKYLNLKNASPIRAYRVAKWIGTRPYDVVGCNCLNDTYDVLRAYGFPDLQPPSDDLLPDVWFGLLSAAFEQIQGYTWARSGTPSLRERIGRAIAKAAPFHVPTWRRAGSPEAHDLQDQIAADKRSRHAGPGTPH